MIANGLILASNPLGAALAPLVAAPLMIAVGRQAAFFVVAGAGFVMAAALWMWLPRPIVAQAEKRRPDNSALVREAGGADGPLPAVVSARQLVRIWTMWHFALVFCGFDIVSWVLVSWAPSFLLEERGVPLAKTGVLAAIPWFVAAVATVLGGWMFDRRFNDRPRRVIVPSMLVTAVFLWFMTQSQTAGEFVLFETLGMAAMWVSFMPTFGLPLRLLPASTAGTGGSLVNFGGQFAGAIAPFVMGWLADEFSFSAAFGFLIFGCLLAVVAAATMPQNPETFQRRLALNTRDDAKAV
jgi:fucose permease